MTSHRVLYQEKGTADRAPQLQRRWVRRTVVVGFGLVSAAILLCLGINWFLTRDTGGGPANAITAQAVLAEFVESLNTGEIESAYRMLDDEARADQTLQSFQAAVRSGESSAAVERYRSLEVCQFQIGLESGGRLLMADGLIHYNGAAMYFTATLRQDSTDMWRVLVFYLDSSADPAPWGACTGEP